MSDRTAHDLETEDLEEYRLRVRAWLAANMTPLDPDDPWDPINDDDDRASRNRNLQKQLSDGGFTGVAYPVEYGGQGLTIAHQRIIDDESNPYEMPRLFSIPTLSITGPTILEYGTEEQKQRYIPNWINGNELWVQFMSEPSGGSDMAGVLTRADRDGDSFVINGSKVWSTFAYRSDYALMLARTNWDVPKHRGLTMFIVPVHHPGIEVQQIKMVDGSDEFCQEFFTDAVISADSVLGEVDDGWTVASSLLVHERAAVSGASAFTQGPVSHGGVVGGSRIADTARANGWTGDPRARDLVAETIIADTIQEQLVERIGSGLQSGHFPGVAGSIVRLFAGIANARRDTIEMELARDSALVWNAGDTSGISGVNFVKRQGGCLGGGSTEMARNLISERVMGMPREASADRGVAFRDVKRNG
jgi:alkylation response protein AidB-like acyl-CoA dehydrogenase